MGMKNLSTQIYLALGSNLGNRSAHIEQALELLKPKIDEVVVSPLYETVPWGVKEQRMFLNVCVGGITKLSAEELLKFVKSVEVQLNRSAQIKWGPREIDIDILFYGDSVIHKPDLVIPHPYLAERAFTLVPLADIAPDLVHPELKYSVAQLLQGVDASGVKCYKL